MHFPKFNKYIPYVLLVLCLLGAVNTEFIKPHWKEAIERQKIGNDLNPNNHQSLSRLLQTTNNEKTTPRTVIANS